MNNVGIMRDYVDMVNGKVLKESISDEMIDIIERRMQKTVGMVNNLISDLDEEEAPTTVEDLTKIAGTLMTAITTLDEVRSSWNSEVVDDFEEEDILEPIEEPIIEPEFTEPDPILNDPEIPNFMRRQAG